jgi:hypothetical protein
MLGAPRLQTPVRLVACDEVRYAKTASQEVLVCLDAVGGRRAPACKTDTLMSGPPQSPNGGSDDPAGPSGPDDRRLAPGLESVSSAGRVVRRSARRRADRVVGAWFSLAQTGVAYERPVPPA